MKRQRFRFYGDPEKALERWRLKKQKRAGTDPESQRTHERKVWWGATLLGLVLAFLAGRG